MRDDRGAMMQELISADDHLLEPASLWQDRLPARFKEMGPRLVENEEGSHWIVEDTEHPMPFKNEFVSGLSADAYGKEQHTLRQSELVPPFYDSTVRAKELRRDGIVGSVCFPTLPRFAGTLFLGVQDKNLADLCVKAWNDYLFEEWCAGDPDFYIPMVITQLWDPKLAAKELRRCAEMGARAVSMPELPSPLGLPSYYTDHWDSVWRAAEELELVVCLHIGTSGRIPELSPEVAFTARIVASETNSIEALVNLLFSPVCTKFPNLQFVVSESGLGWVPAFLERSDREWETHRIYDEQLGPNPPSEVWASNFHGCFVGDPIAVMLRHEIGVDNMLWEFDYPHAESPYPNSQKVVSEIFADVSQDEVDRITHGNARRLFRW